MKVAFAVVVVAVIAGALWWFGGKDASPTEACPGPYADAQGNKFLGNCTVYDENGRAVQFKSFRGKHLFINFWASWCPPCRQEMPAMEELWHERKEQNFAMLAVSLPWRGETEEKAKNFFFTEYGFTYRFAFDRDDAVTTAYGVPNIPATLLVSPDGTIAVFVSGARHWDTATCRKLLDAWMAGLEITRGLLNGCR